MVDEEGSTLEETSVQTRSAELGTRSEGRGRNLECGNLLPRCGGQSTAQLELSPRRYHVFARAADREWWSYIAAIHRKADAWAVSAGLIQTGLAVEVEIGVIAQGPGPRAGRVIVIHREPANGQGDHHSPRALDTNGEVRG
jgi:hypothetical protein